MFVIRVYETYRKRKEFSPSTRELYLDHIYRRTWKAFTLFGVLPLFVWLSREERVD